MLEKFKVVKRLRFPAIARWQLTAQISSNQWNDIFRANPETQHASGPGCDRRGDYVVKIAGRGSRNQIARRLLQREAIIARSVSHPNLVSVLDASLESEPSFIVQPFYAGRNLQELINSSAHTSAPFRLWILRQVAQAVSALHEHSIVHCDIAPRNIMVSNSGHVTLIDLGLAQVPALDPLPAHHLAGSLDYLAPEQLDGNGRLTKAVDVYALGAIMFQLLGGRLPSRDRGVESNGVDSIDSARTRGDELSLAKRRLLEFDREGRFADRVTALLGRMIDANPLQRPEMGEVIEVLVRNEINGFAFRNAA